MDNITKMSGVVVVDGLPTRIIQRCGRVCAVSFDAVASTLTYLANGMKHIVTDVRAFWEAHKNEGISAFLSTAFKAVWEWVKGAVQSMFQAIKGWFAKHWPKKEAVVAAPEAAAVTA